MPESDSVMRALGGRKVDQHQAPFLHRRIKRLSKSAEISEPVIYIIPEESPNACAVGFDANDTAVAVTTGLLRKLDENEIDAVLAHEIAHIKQGHSISKTKVACRALMVNGVAEMAGHMVAQSDLDFTPGDDDSGDMASTLIKIGLGIATATAGAALAANMMTTESFKSEYEADKIGGTLSKKPWALARALRKIEEFSSQHSNQKYAPEVAQLFIISPSFLEHRTHPATTSRVEALSHITERQAREIGETHTEFCVFCGEKTDLDGAFCMYCGKNLDD